jgi:endonuclease III related protein
VDTSLKFSNKVLMTLYQKLLLAYGSQNWWPAGSQFEVVVGAVLTQNTAWVNVEKAIENLKLHGYLSLNAITRLEHSELADIIRASGYFNVKATRLKHLCDWLALQGGMHPLETRPTEELRQQLLQIHGIGPETADDILLYAFNRPVFVIDAYTRRLLTKLGLITGNEAYEVLRRGFESSLEQDHGLYNEYHALIVRHAKERCSGEKDCRHCSVESAVSA